MCNNPQSKKPACFSSGSFNFRLLFFSSAALLTPSPLRKFVSDKKVVAGCLAFENSSLGRRLLYCEHLFCYRCPFADYCFFGVDPEKHFEEWA